MFCEVKRMLVGATLSAVLAGGLSCGNAPTDAIAGAGGLLTGSGIDQTVKSAMTAVSNLGADLAGDGLVAANGVNDNLGALLHQFDKMAKDHMDKPLNELGGDVRDAGIQLNSMATRLNQLVDYQHDRIYDDLAVFQAGLETITFEAKRGFVPWAKDASPRLYYFESDGTHLPNYVPKQGGRITITGYRLWESTEPAGEPAAEVCDANRQPISKLVPGHGSSENAISVDLGPDLVRGHAGQQLSLHVVPHDKRGRQTADLFLPMVLPQDYVTQFKLVGGISYSTAHVGRATLGSQRFTADNPSCEDRLTISQSHAWTLQPGQRIVDFTTHVVAKRENNGIQLAVRGLDQITAAGWLDTADCTMVGPIHALHHHAEWVADVTPIVEFSTDNARNSTGESTPVELAVPSTTLLLNLPKDATPDGTFWFQVIPVINGKPARVLYASPNVQFTGHGGTAAAIEVAHYMIAGAFNPSPVNGKGQVSVVVTTPRAR